MHEVQWGKEAQRLAANTAAVGTPWEELLERHAALTASDGSTNKASWRASGENRSAWCGITTLHGHNERPELRWWFGLGRPEDCDDAFEHGAALAVHRPVP
jgi:hypothetical protein